MEAKKILLMTWKKSFLLVVLWFVAVILHNLVFAIFGFEDAIFFIIAIFVLPIYFIVSMAYTLVVKIGGFEK